MNEVVCLKVKICGNTTVEDALKACELGADLLGLIFADKSPRKITPERGRQISDAVRRSFSDVKLIGLFVDAPMDKVFSSVDECLLDGVQLHGSESPGYCSGIRNGFGDDKIIIKAIRVEGVPDSRYLLSYGAIDHFLFDAYHPLLSGGSGKVFDWDLLEMTDIQSPFFLAGGLTPDNVSEAVRKVRPYGVDVASGVEMSPGVKDEKRLKEFIENAKNA